MKRNSLIFMLLAALFMPLALHAQQALPYEYSFEDNDLTADGWTTSNPGNSAIMNLYTGGPHYYVYGFAYTSNPPQYLISPELTGTENGVHVEFEYCIYNSNYGVETFEVGYSTTTTATSSFTWGTQVTASNAIASGGSWLTYSKDFPAGTKYVAVKHTTYDVLYLFVDEFSFTEPDLCGTPNNLTTTDVTTNSATLSWEGIQQNYTVRYRTAPGVDFFEDFEEGIPSTWTLIDNDGDSNNWTGASGGMDDTNCATSWSYDATEEAALTPDNWLCTPRIALNGEMRVMIKAQDPNWAEEHFAIYLTTASSPTVNNFTSGTTLVAETVATGEYVEYSYDLSSFNGQMGYIAIRHFNCTDMFRLNVDNFGIYGIEQPAGQWRNVGARETTTKTITGLAAETEYEWQVRGTCPDGYTDWSIRANFTTPSACDTPNSLVANDITDDSAVLNWTGYQNSYTIQYTPMALAYEADFSEGIPSGWTTIDNDGDGNNWVSGSNVVYSESFINDVGALTPDNWLVSSQVPMGGVLMLTAYGSDPAYADEHFAIYYSRQGGTSINSYTQISEEYVTTANPTVYTIDLSAYSGNGYLAIRHFNCTDMFRFFVTNFEVYTMGTPITVQNVTTTSYTMTNLNFSTPYMVQVKGTCTNGETDWSEAYVFTTSHGNVFQTAGRWDVASNWKYNVIPEEGADVTIRANIIVPAGYAAIANQITIADGASLTIADGGQLHHNTSGLKVTMQKNVPAYTGSRDNYKLLAFPFSNDVAVPEGMTATEGNDFYMFYNSMVGEEWQNNKVDAIDVVWAGPGFLYANPEAIALSMTGNTYRSYDSYLSMTLYYNEDENNTEENGNNSGWTLLGNPFTCDAYIYGETDEDEDIFPMDVMYYDANGNMQTISAGPVAPMQGFFVKVTDTTTVYFTTFELLFEDEGEKSLPSHAINLDKKVNKTVATIDKSVNKPVAILDKKADKTFIILDKKMEKKLGKKDVIAPFKKDIQLKPLKK